MGGWIDLDITYTDARQARSSIPISREQPRHSATRPVSKRSDVCTHICRHRHAPAAAAGRSSAAQPCSKRSDIYTNRHRHAPPEAEAAVGRSSAAQSKSPGALAHSGRWAASSSRASASRRMVLAERANRQAAKQAGRRCLLRSCWRVWWCAWMDRSIDGVHGGCLAREEGAVAQQISGPCTHDDGPSFLFRFFDRSIRGCMGLIDRSHPIESLESMHLSRPSACARSMRASTQAFSGSKKSENKQRARVGSRPLLLRAIPSLPLHHTHPPTTTNQGGAWPIRRSVD